MRATITWLRQQRILLRAEARMVSHRLTLKPNPYPNPYPYPIPNPNPNPNAQTLTLTLTPAAEAGMLSQTAPRLPVPPPGSSSPPAVPAAHLGPPTPARSDSWDSQNSNI